ncbi:MAG: hypothetical protein F6K23_18340 [Okeania sp. SIO2C9]|uniref:sulfotransferase domain-containing protein n=1 Tax=Okeania sp. SIO2C9 TaxID=2607791 RepID=UPI0013C1C74C|nr:sulfotransferase domain-containing protein [Okeania sp. SIO2C9]NEQ74827.1 hypothetical protein [Okeania sp. SIO2C9]
MTLPSFIIIGAQKCGTTSLYNYVIEHPQILPASMKELHFFNWRSKPGNRKTVEGVDWYLSQFPTIPNGKNLITGEATPDYLVDPHTPQRMFNLLPDVKLIVLLRNPIDRAVSHYHHNRGISKKREPLPFIKAIEKESERLNIEKEKLISDENYRSLFHRNYSYLERGIYIEQLEKWMSIFPREQFLILKSEDFYARPDVTLKEVFEFLGLPNYQVTNKKKYNEIYYQPINPKIRSNLAEYFQPYNQKLEEYLGRKFNWEMNGNKEQKQHISLSQVKEKLHNYQSELEQIKSKMDSKSISKSRQTFQEVEENVINSFVQSSTTSTIVVENYDADSHPIYDELFWGYEITEIQEKTNNQDTINISGWVLGKNSPVVAIEIVELSSILKKVSVNQLYPDIAKRYPEAPQVEEIGFSIDFQVNKLRPKFNWLIQAVFADKTRMPIGCIRTNNTKSLNIKSTPLLTEEAIKFLENFLKQKPHAKVLEFGSGGSTIWLSKLTKNLTSIEHDGRWFQQVKNQIQKQKNCHPVDIKLLARPYHKICEKIPEESFDLILVDGRDRMKCFEASIKLLKPGGILMLDDAQREKYKQAQDLLRDWQFTKTVSKNRHTYWWQKTLQKITNIEPNQSLKNQKQISHKSEESVIIAGVSMVKDEEDIIYYTLAGNYQQGITKFVVLDHLSSDKTTDEIRRFADDYPEAMVYLIEDRDPLFHKFRKMSAAAEFAHRMWGAKWIFPFDADEVIASLDKPLRNILSQLGPKHFCLGLQHRNYLPRSFYDSSEPNPLKRMTHRKKEDTSLFRSQGYSKVIVRWQLGMEIAQGHHHVKFEGKKLPVTALGKNHGLILRQYRYRSREQIKQKIVNGGKAYEVSQDISQKHGGFWQERYKQYQKEGEKFIDEFYATEINGSSDAIYDPAWL